MKMDMSPTTASSAPAATSAMSMSMGSGSDCKISMLWNWYTVDACFLSSTWHITSHGMFAGSCIGVIFLVLSLEFLRRLGKEYDRYLASQHNPPQQQVLSQDHDSVASEGPLDDCRDSANSKHNQHEHTRSVTRRWASDHSAAFWNKSPLFIRRRRPNVKQQLIRAILHMLQFGVAYFIMLLAMYYNGYIIICILIGAFLGAFIFSWDAIGDEQGANEEPTVCCG